MIHGVELLLTISPGGGTAKAENILKYMYTWELSRKNMLHGLENILKGRPGEPV